MRSLAAVACLCLLPAVGLAQAPDEEKAALGPVPRILRPEPQADRASALLHLEAAAEEAESNAPKRGFLHGLLARIKGQEVAADVRIEDVLGAKPEDVAGKLVRVEGLLRPQDSDTIVPLLTADEPEAQLRFSLSSGGVEAKRLQTDEGRVLDTPVVITGRVNVPEVESGAKPEYTLVGAEAALAAPAMRFRAGLLYEANENWEKAVATYADAFQKKYRSHELAPLALFRAAQIADEHYADERKGDKRAAKLYSALWTNYVQGAHKQGREITVLREEEGQVREVTVRLAVGKRMDALNSANILYKIMQVFALICGGSGALGVLLLAFVTRLVMFPLAKKQVVAQRGMQKLQPELKRIQEKYKDDRATQQKKMMQLYREHGVSMFGGCLPLLVQMPILIALYMGIRMYIYQFSLESFLWVPDLSAPDMPLLIAYTISMVIFQKITAKSTPATDPQQQQMQQTMAWMMPIMFFFIFQTFPAAFILYWLGTNIIYAGQQYWLTRGLDAPKPGEVVTMKPSAQRENPAPEEEEAVEGAEEQEEDAPGEEPAQTRPAPRREAGPRKDSRQAQKRMEREQRKKHKKERRRQQRLKKQKRRQGRGKRMSRGSQLSGGRGS
ncbi:MAG: membrane protein insertase YidC [Armatimonadota bacterium]